MIIKQKVPKIDILRRFNLVFFMFLFVVFHSCNGVKNVYTAGALDMGNHMVKKTLEVSKAEAENLSIIHFTYGFDGEIIQIRNGEDVVFDHKAYTIPQLSLCCVQVVDRTKNVTINIHLKNSKSFLFSLNKKKMRSYKFVYINKMLDQDRFVVEYSNKNKNFE